MNCGHVIKVVGQGSGTLTCCDEPMKKLKENTSDGAKEKHVPVIEKTADGFLVKVGSVAHPMTEEHYIEWIELIADGKSCIQFLEPDGKPEASFQVKASQVTARELCNLHGLWKASL
jgi:superoxide reductase